ncbi:MFS transporter [Amycolatopsis pithecellobii]|uniref:MFS transporter n=1 Tax=Amycolatopsis pithecellobii TaxID=664692 RepID=A0A6N7Z6H2_9PSEU|nr:MFS transporter [Amycolatopsis pithecellobii]MTD56494.1 MFS transporter [Amycolatopsis pithecellobii]
MTVAMTRGARSASSLIIVLCGLLIFFDGYDLVVYGNVVPSLLAEPGWGLSSVDIGRIASLTTTGMGVGALVSGPLADRVGRRAIILVSMVLFSVSMVACALVPGAGQFEIARALGGVGLGALFPSAIALIVEFARPGKQALTYSLAFFGYLIGGIVAAGLGILLIRSAGWRVMFGIGALPLLLLPVMLRYLPESPTWLNARGRIADARAIADRFGIVLGLRDEPAKSASGTAGSWRGAFARHYLVSTFVLWLVEICGYFLVFGIVTWLPAMMKAVGYSLGAALTFSLVLNLGAGIGALAGARHADRRGPKTSVTVLFAVGTVGLVLVPLRPPGWAAFLLIALAGVGTLGAQMLLNTLAASLYPVTSRGSGLGWALAIGRVGAIVGPLVFGALLARHGGAVTSFYILGAVSAAAAVLATALPLTPAARAAVAALRHPRPAETADQAAAPASGQ